MTVDVVFEDEFLIAVNKPAGLVVHGGSESLETWVARYVDRPAILLHRLDKDTTGIVLLAKRRDAAGPLSRAFAEKKIRKSYWAVVSGRWPKDVNRVESFISRSLDGGWVSRAIGGATSGVASNMESDMANDVASDVASDMANGDAKRALTTFRILAASDEKTWLEAIPKTGRTHQIRLHCQSAGHAILGDRLYGQSNSAEAWPHALHACRLDFKHPITGEPMRLVAEPPEYWRKAWLTGLKIDSVYHSFFK